MKESGNEEYLSENEMSKLYASTSFGQLPVLTFFHMGSNKRNLYSRNISQWEWRMGLMYWRLF